MIDLTPLDVRKKRGDFRPKLRGYDPEEVDGFLELVAERFEELVKENLTLSERVERFGSQLKALEGRESAVHEALVSAQKLREEVSDQTQKEVESLREHSRREAVILKAEAETEISRRLGDAEGLIRERQWALEELERSRKKFLKGFRSLLEREIEALEVEEARRPLEETPLDLNLRGWTPDGEEEEPEEGALESAEDETLSGFATQKLEVSVTSDLGDEMEPTEVEDEAGPEPGSPALDQEVEMEPDPVEFADQVPHESEGTEFVDGMAEEVVSAEVMDEEPDDLESVEFTDEYDDVATLEPEMEGEIGMEESQRSSTPQEPKWLFSLLKREDGDGPEGEAEDGKTEGEV